MTPNDAIAAYAALSPGEQIRVLARYAFDLTVAARETYVPQTDDVADPRRLRQFNEIQHRVIGHLGHLLAGDTGRYPDSTIVQIIVAGNDPAQLSLFEEALRRHR